MTVRVAINGFGRIGKNILRIYLEGGRDIEIAAINSTSGPEPHAHLLKYDSVYGVLPEDVKVKENAIEIGGEEILFTAERDPENLPWGKLGIDVVIEATGKLRKRADAEKHIKAGAKKVIITAPAEEPDITIVMGVNHKNYNPSKHNIISAASCTTNCLAPVAKVLTINLELLMAAHHRSRLYCRPKEVDKLTKITERARVCFPFHSADNNRSRQSYRTDYTN